MPKWRGLVVTVVIGNDCFVFVFATLETIRTNIDDGKTVTFFIRLIEHRYLSFFFHFHIWMYSLFPWWGFVFSKFVISCVQRRGSVTKCHPRCKNSNPTCILFKIIKQTDKKNPQHQTGSCSIWSESKHNLWKRVLPRHCGLDSDCG